MTQLEDAAAVDPRTVWAPTPGRLSDLLHVELSTGARAGTTYGTDTYGEWDYGGKIAWDRWDCDIVELRLERGRQRELERNAPGVAAFTGVERVPSGWLAAAPPTGRPMRIVTSDNRLVFAGTIEAAELTKEWGAATWQVTACDDLARLGRLEMSTFTRPVETLAARIEALLTIGSIAYGGQGSGHNVQAVAGSQRKLLDELGIAVDTWRWHLYNVGAAALIDRRGLFTITGPSAPGTPPWNSSIYPWVVSPDPPAGTTVPPSRRWLGDALGITCTIDLVDVRNAVTFANAGGTAVTTKDDASVTTFGARTYQRLDLIGADGGTAPASDALVKWAQYTLDATPKARLRTCTVDCWYRPAGAAPLIDLLAELDVGHSFACSFPDQDDDGGRITTDNAGARVLGLAWDLGDREALLTLTIDAPILRRPT